MGLINLFKGKIDVGHVVNSVISAGDKLAFTKEEKADFNLTMADKLAAFAENTLSENTIRSKTRRHVALLVTYTFLVLVLAAIVMHFIDAEKSKFIAEIVKDSPISTAFVMVLAFFFGGYYMKGISLTKKK